MSKQDLIKAFEILKENPNLIGSCEESIDKELIKKAEDYLGITFPVSYKEFLARYGYISLGGYEIYGVLNDDFVNSGVPDAIWLTMTDRNQFNFPHHLIRIYDVGEGTEYCLDTSQMNEEGECPVVVWPIFGYEATPVLEIEAEDFGKFLLNTIQRAIESKNDDDPGYFS